jgi:predicted DNA-binding transcriptional regulator AlpA
MGLSRSHRVFANVNLQGHEMIQTIQANPGSVLLPRRELRERIPVSDMTIWRWVRDGVFPKPVSINRRNYWRTEDIEAWLAERSASRGEAA